MPKINKTKSKNTKNSMKKTTNSKSTRVTVSKTKSSPKTSRNRIFAMALALSIIMISAIFVIRSSAYTWTTLIPKTQNGTVNVCTSKLNGLDIIRVRYVSSRALFTNLRINYGPTYTAPVDTVLSPNKKYTWQGYFTLPTGSDAVRAELFTNTTVGPSATKTLLQIVDCDTGLLPSTTTPPPPPTTTPPPPPSGTGISGRSMWIWNDVLPTTDTGIKTILDFAVAKQVSVAYMYSEALLPNNPNALQNFINQASSRGITVELLFGEPTWALSTNHSAALRFVTLANQLVASSTGAKPVALHFDIEPQSLPEWSADSVSVANQMLDLYGKMMTSKNPSLKIYADYQMAFDTFNVTRNGVTRPMVKWLIDTIDGGTIMSYRDYASGADGIIDHATVSVNYAATLGKKVKAGVETTCGVLPIKITFCEEGDAYMNAELQKVESAFAGNAGYAGVAVHDYTAYKVLKP